MLINGINYPHQLLEAIKNNNLVIFAGAGVSIPEPTHMPSFIDLAKIIGANCHKPYVIKTDDGKEKVVDEVDVFLGDLERQNKPIKKKVVELLSAKEGQTPNSFHKGLIDLFKSDNSIRIVTTNQDEMFEKALDASNRTYKVYNAPALPYGNDFIGLVHLHGVVSDPKHMVITDTDFGDAYMLNGYASRFLKELFQQYTVLFIGYSYNDRIVRYLTSAITAKSIANSYILNDWKDEVLLNRLNIESIKFEKECFDQECESIIKLGELNRRNIFDWEERMNIFPYPYDIDDETRDEILEGIKSLSIQKRFCATHNGSEWLLWLDKYNVLDNLFIPNIKLDKNDIEWAEWIAQNNLDDSLLNLVESHQNNINGVFGRFVLYYLSNDTHISDELFTSIALVFKNSVQPDVISLQLVEAAERHKLYDLMWELFFELCCSYDFVPTDRVYSGSSTGFELSWNIYYSLLENIYNNRLSKHIENPEYVINCCLAVIKKLYIYCEHNNHTRMIMYDLDNQDVEKDGALLHDEYFSLLCRIIDESLSSMDMETSSEFISYTSKTLISDKYYLLKNIGLKILRLYSDSPAEDKASLVLEYFDLSDVSVREQLHLIVSNLFDQLSLKTKNTIIDNIWDINMDNCDEQDPQMVDEITNKIRYDWLNYLKVKCSKNDRIEDRISKIQNDYPHFKPGKSLSHHPAFTVENINSESPKTETDLYKMKTEECCNFLTSYQPDSGDFVHGRMGLLSTFQSAVSKRCNWGMQVLKTLCDQKLWTEDVWIHLFWGLSDGVDSVKGYLLVLDALNDEILENCTKGLSRFLFLTLRKECITRDITKESIDKTERIIEQCWKFRDCEDGRYDSLDFYQRTINETEGMLSHSLLQLVYIEREDEEGIPEWFNVFVKENILGQEQKNLQFICVMCGYSPLLFYKNPKWANEHIIQYLNTKNSEVKKAAWNGILSFGISHSEEYCNFILPALLNEIEYCNLLSFDLKRNFIQIVTYISIVFLDYPLLECVVPLIKIIEPSDRVIFAQAVKNNLERIDQKQKEKIWNTWLKDYWHNRNDNMPCELSPDEYCIMLLWLFEFDDFDSIADIALESDVDKINATQFLMRLNDSELLSKYPEKCAKLVIKIALHSDRSIIDYQLKQVEEKLQDNLTSKELKSELYQAVNG